MKLLALISVLIAAALAALTGTTTAAGGGSNPAQPCRLGPPATDRPAADAVPLLRLSSVSSWTEPWEYGASLSVYADGTVARVQPAQETGGSLRRIPPVEAVVLGLQAGWVDGCELRELVQQGVELAARNMGRVTSVMDANSAVVEIGADQHRVAVRIGVYALGMGDTDNPDLTAEQERARVALQAWITAVRAAVHPSGPMSLERLRLVELPDAGNGDTDPDGRVATWRGPVPQLRQERTDGRNWMHPCAVLTGTDARQAGLAMSDAHPHGLPRKHGAARGEFVVDGRTRTFGMVALAPGEGCI